MRRVAIACALLITNVWSADTTGIYLGAGVGVEKVDNYLSHEDTLTGGMVKLGYGFTNNIGVELRANQSFADSKKLEHTYSVGAYVKPSYDIADSVNVYGLFGYGENKIKYSDASGTFTDASTDAFSAGLGIEYKVTNKLSFFLEGMRVVNKKADEEEQDVRLDIKGLYFGVNYYFNRKDMSALNQNPLYDAPQKINILFDTAKFDVKEGYHSELNNYANFLMKNPTAKIDILGYTDSRGSDIYNLKLSQHRAESIRGYLINKGVEPVRMEAVGLGEDFPVGNNMTEIDRALNRRIEARLYQE